MSDEVAAHRNADARPRPGARGRGTRIAVLVGFHGYTENADIQMERLAALPGSERWTLVSVQGLHRFYRGRSPGRSSPAG